jgi:hypothetical protein
MGSKKTQTVGHRYYMGLHFGLCHGPVDEVQQVKSGDREVWAGSATSNTSLSVNKPELFGGDKKEGGVVGTLDIAMGGSAQTANSYLSSKIGGIIPAFRGVLSAIWRGGQISANNPYIKPWAFRVKRITQGWAGGAAWYSDKSAIDTGVSEPAELGSGSAVERYSYGEQCRYFVTTHDDMALYLGDVSAWPTGAQPVANTPNPVYLSPDVGTVGLNAENVGFWIQKTIQLPKLSSVRFEIPHDNDFEIFINGVSRTAEAYVTGPFLSQLDITPETLTLDVRLVVRNVMNGTGPSANPCYIGLRATQYEYPVRGMNPAHIIYQCITDTAWGMGYPTSTSIDSASFTAAADTLYAEDFGLCMVWNQQDSIESFIKTVLDHMGGILYVKPDTGKFALKLLRGDYDRNTLPLYTPGNIESVSDYQRQAWGETINEITVVYRDVLTNKDASVTVQDLANIQTQGAVVSQVRQYPGVPASGLAQRVAMRDLDAVSTPLAKIKLKANRNLWALMPGDVFRLTWPDHGIDDAVYRVLEVDKGTLQDGSISIDAAEDIFGMPSNTYIVDQPGGWEEPTTAPAAAPYRKLLDAPYWDLARSLSAADLSYIDPLASYLETLAVRPSGDALDYEINAKVGAGSYEVKAQADFCPTATLSVAISKTETAITIGNMIDVDIAQTGGYAYLGDECVGITALDAVTGTATITRGLLDTVPVAHSIGERLWFADDYQGVDQTEYASGEVVDAKLLPRTGQGELPIDDAPADSLTMTRRQNRPYPPGKLRTNGSVYPEWIDGFAELALTWAHRDRLTQTASLVTQDENSIGPEASTTYTLRIYSEGDSLIRTETGIEAASYTYTSSAEVADGGSSGDPYYTLTELLLHMNGANGSTEFTDSSPAPKTVTPAGNAQISTASPKFGTGCGNFDGTGDYLQVGVASNWKFLHDCTTPWTLEGWFKFTNFTSSHGLFTTSVTTAQAGLMLYVNSSRQIVAGVFNGTPGQLVCGMTTGTAVPNDSEYHHIALTFDYSLSTNNAKIWIDGTLAGQITKTANVPSTSNPVNTLVIGAYAGFLALGNLNGKADEIRITKGLSRYAAAFAPPDAEFLDSNSVRLNGRLRYQLESVRDGVASHTYHEHTVLREGYGFNYGYYYGGQ